MEEKNVALILAAGAGIRMGGAQPKVFLPLLGKPLLAWTLSVFESSPRIHEIIVVVPPAGKESCQRDVLIPYQISKVKLIVPGGARRQDSIQNGFAAITGSCRLVVIHDGARPFLDSAILDQSLVAAEAHGAAAVAVPMKDTIKVVDNHGLVQKTLDREQLWAAQTPQVYAYPIIKAALEKAAAENIYGTDDAFLVERLGFPVRIVSGSYENIKVTTPEDLAWGELILKRRGAKTESPGSQTP